MQNPIQPDSAPRDRSHHKPLNLVKNKKGKFAYVTVGGLNQVKVYARGDGPPHLVATIPVGHLPHGIWPSGDGTRVYIALEMAELLKQLTP